MCVVIKFDHSEDPHFFNIHDILKSFYDICQNLLLKITGLSSNQLTEIPSEGLKYLNKSLVTLNLGKFKVISQMFFFLKFFI